MPKYLPHSHFIYAKILRGRQSARDIGLREGCSVGRPSLVYAVVLG